MHMDIFCSLLKALAAAGGRNPLPAGLSVAAAVKTVVDNQRVYHTHKFASGPQCGSGQNWN